MATAASATASITRGGNARPDGRLDVIARRCARAHVRDARRRNHHRPPRRRDVPSPPARSDVAAAAEEDDAGGRLVAPIPGQVTQVLRGPGMTVTRGQILVVLEAMKTVFRLAAPADGIVATVSCQVGDSVVEGQLLVGFAEEEAPQPRTEGCCIERRVMTRVGRCRGRDGGARGYSHEKEVDSMFGRRAFLAAAVAAAAVTTGCDSGGHARRHRDRDQDRQHRAVQRPRIVLRRARQAGERVLRHGERAGRRRRPQDQLHLARRQLQPAEDRGADPPAGRGGEGRLHLRRRSARRPTARSCAT